MVKNEFQKTESRDKACMPIPRSFTVPPDLVSTSVYFILCPAAGDQPINLAAQNAETEYPIWTLWRDQPETWEPL